MRLEDKTAIVTGAARGIGRAIALHLTGEGCHTVLVDREPSHEVERSIKKMGGQCIGVTIDVSRIEAVQKMVKRAVEKFGRIDILVNNAGIIHRGDFTALTPEDWNRVLSVNLGGTFNCCHFVVPHMIRQGSGKIINITSVAGVIGDITASPAYGTSKGAINTLTKSLARQLAQFGIIVNAVAPHAIETDMSRQWSDEKRQSIVSDIPLGRLGKPEEVAAAVIYLASHGADFVTGETINVNGGYVMQ